MSSAPAAGSDAGAVAGALAFLRPLLPGLPLARISPPKAHAADVELADAGAAAEARVAAGGLAAPAAPPPAVATPSPVRAGRPAVRQDSPPAAPRSTAAVAALAASDSVYVGHEVCAVLCCGLCCGTHPPCSGPAAGGRWVGAAQRACRLMWLPLMPHVPPLPHRHHCCAAHRTSRVGGGSRGRCTGAGQHRAPPACPHDWAQQAEPRARGTLCRRPGGRPGGSRRRRSSAAIRCRSGRGRSSCRRRRRRRRPRQQGHWRAARTTWLEQSPEGLAGSAAAPAAGGCGSGRGRGRLPSHQGRR